LHRRDDDPKPTSPRDYVGTRYAFRQSLKDGHRCYRLRALGDKPNSDERNLAPESVRPIFLRVVLGCIVSA